jgi:DNA-binding MarR family transcriptional regulator
VTGIINRLEKKGLVARLPKKEDKRITYISLTSNGFKLMEETPDLLHQKLLKKLDLLPEKDLTAIRDSLKKLISLLGIQELDASPLLMVDDPSL